MKTIKIKFIIPVLFFYLAFEVKRTVATKCKDQTTGQPVWSKQCSSYKLFENDMYYDNVKDCKGTPDTNELLCASNDDVRAVTDVECNTYCDFEDDFCDWHQDKQDDEDWTRHEWLDHTVGGDAYGHYLQIDKLNNYTDGQNYTARIFSPPFDKKLGEEKGCFQFFYRLGRGTEIELKIYQKPSGVNVTDLEEYRIFAEPVVSSLVWRRGVATLKNFSKDFQIIIEGVIKSQDKKNFRIDDVAILKHENCEKAKTAHAASYKLKTNSCAGRCGVSCAPASRAGCDCTAGCAYYGNCCGDFAALCKIDTSSFVPPPATPPPLDVSSESVVTTSVKLSTEHGLTRSPTTPESYSAKAETKNNHLMYIAIGGGGATAFIGLVSLVAYCCYRKRNQPSTTERRTLREEQPDEDGTNPYSYAAIPIVPTYDARALVASNKKLGERSFTPHTEPRDPAQPFYEEVKYDEIKYDEIK